MLKIIFNLVMHGSHAVLVGAQATTAQLYPGHDTFEFDQGHVTKIQPITMLVLLGERPGIQYYNIKFSTSDNAFHVL